MLDENLPVFFLKPSASGIKHHRSLYLAHHGSDAEPCYRLQYADPAAQTSHNCYAAAIFDAYTSDVLYGEVLARPHWTQPSLCAEELRRNGGVAPPPQPVLPHDFVVQLYDPDLQVTVTQKEGKWGGSNSYEFSMPQTAFRAPSASTLDKTQSDPASLPVTPRITFVWRKESKLNKDLTCFMTGKSTDTVAKKKSQRDPDIAVALWRGMREMTLYEPNLYRVEMEDPKGLEVVLLLSAVVIKDLYFASSSHMHELFNIADPEARKLSAGGRKISTPPSTAFPTLTVYPVPPSRPTTTNTKRSTLPRLTTTPSTAAPPPPADPRAQWTLDRETAALKAQAASEAHDALLRRRARDKSDEAESRRLRAMLDAEARAARAKQVAVERETERLRALYGVQHLPPGPSLLPHDAQRGNRSRAVGKEKSFWALRGASDDGRVSQDRVRKKRSAMW